jgi:hypothetical protein
MGSNIHVAATPPRAVAIDPTADQRLFHDGRAMDSAQKSTARRLGSKRAPPFS